MRSEERKDNGQERDWKASRVIESGKGFVSNWEKSDLADRLQSAKLYRKSVQNPCERQQILLYCLL